MSFAFFFLIIFLQRAIFYKKFQIIEKARQPFKMRNIQRVTSELWKKLFMLKYSFVGKKLI